jgi:hypothetical protein
MWITDNRERELTAFIKQIQHQTTPDVFQLHTNKVELLVRVGCLIKDQLPGVDATNKRTRQILRSIDYSITLKRRIVNRENIINKPERMAKLFGNITPPVSDQSVHERGLIAIKVEIGHDWSRISAHRRSTGLSTKHSPITEKCVLHKEAHDFHKGLLRPEPFVLSEGHT